MKQIFKYPLMLCFFAYILFFTAFDLTQTNKVFSEFENRYLDQKPQFSIKALLDNSFSQKYESYINDQFVLRDDWIALKSVSEAALLKIENNGIAYGADNYMFEKFQRITGSQYGRNLDFLVEFAQMYPEEPITFIAVPNSYEVLSDKVPKGLGNVDQRAEIERIYSTLPLKTVDLLPALSKHSNEYIYYRTDHHWTTLGAYLGYSEYIESIGKTPMPLSDMQGQDVPEFYGTYFSKAKSHNAVPDVITYYSIPAASVEIDGKKFDGYYDLEKFDARDKYAAMLRGNNGYTVIKSAANRDRGETGASKVLVVKDSYANSLVPYLLYHFDEVHVMDLRSNLVRVSETLAENNFDEVLIIYNFMNLVTDTNIYRLRY